MKDYWHAELGPGVWLQDLGVPVQVLNCCWGDWFLTLFGKGSGVFQNLCWPISGQGCCLDGVWAESGLLSPEDLSPQAVGLWFYCV